MTAEQIAELARELAVYQPIDFGLIAHDEDQAYKKMAEAALTIHQNHGSDEVLLATITYLLVENFVLHAQLMGKLG